jgi:DNA (cytosine-5)-methyltransferase 1
LLTSSLRTIHTDLSKKRFLETRQGETEPVSRFHKLDPRGVCNTIRASGRPAIMERSRRRARYIPGRRAASPCAKLRACIPIPTGFRLHTTKWHGFRRIGNSVPPLLARAVASRVREAFLAHKKSDRSVAQGDSGWLSFGMSEAAAH